MGNEIPLLADWIGFRNSGGLTVPLHQQIYSKIRQAVLERFLKPGDKLPASRLLADDLGISRNTVTAAYDQLVAEGFLLTRTGAGTFVSELNLDGARHQTDGEPTAEAMRADFRPAVSKRVRSAAATEPKIESLNGAYLLPGFVDPLEFPYPQWNRLYKRQNQSVHGALPLLCMRSGFTPLRCALASHLAITRGVDAEPDQIFVTAGTAQSLALITRVLSDPGDQAWVEEPGYPPAVEALRYADLVIQPVPVDHQGLCPDQRLVEAAIPRLIYATTSYQFPLGYTMPVARRSALLNIADRKNAWILEDDYDGEFRYRGKPIPSLFGFEGNRRTIYMGTFSKTLSPSLRMSFVVVPRRLINVFRQVYPMLGNESSIATQATLAEFITRGFFARHVKRMRKIYGARRAALEQALRSICGVDNELFEDNPGGLHLTLGITGPVTDIEIVEAVRSKGLGCLPLSLTYQAAAQAQQGLLLGYTFCNEEVIHRSIAGLHGVMQKKNTRFTSLTQAHQSG